MPRLDVAPTKCNQLMLSRQLGVAEEGYGLLEQKRQLLVLELLRWLDRARELETRAARAVAEAHAALSAAELDVGPGGLARIAVGTRREHEVSVRQQSLMGIPLPHATAGLGAPPMPLGVAASSASTDEAIDRFVALVPLLAELAAAAAAVTRLSAELRKTQRRCNALSRIFIPSYRDTLRYIAGSLEERERESLVILKMVRDRLGRSA